MIGYNGSCYRKKDFCYDVTCLLNEYSLEHDISTLTVADCVDLIKSYSDYAYAYFTVCSKTAWKYLSVELTKAIIRVSDVGVKTARKIVKADDSERAIYCMDNFRAFKLFHGDN